MSTFNTTTIWKNYSKTLLCVLAETPGYKAAGREFNPDFEASVLSLQIPSQQNDALNAKQG
jgi:hypothetical protein